MKIERSWYCS